MLITLLTGLILAALLLAALLLATLLPRLVLSALLLTTLVLLAALVLLVLIWIVHRRFPSMLTSLVQINKRPGRSFLVSFDVGLSTAGVTDPGNDK